ncbi:hypothetical protein GWK77_04390 [Candidatus Saccharibacteria bacterium oral taxon 488]|nr:hypothetical protein GWK77_04390 [Candidatus Saccharibacteria bacterium oral taxon 488]
MIGATSTAEVSSTGIDGDGFDVFSSLRDSVSGEDLSFGIGETAADSVEQFDLVAVASGEAELNTVTNSKPESKETSAPVNPEQCQKYGTIACIGCGLRQFCEERQAAMMAGNTELQPGEQLSTLEQLLREDDAPGEIVWARPLPDDFDGEELPVADGPRVVETSADKPDGPTEKITPQEQESKASTSKPVEASGEDVDTEAAEAPFFGLKMAPETIADDIKDVGEALSESTRNVLSDISGEEHFTEPTEESRPSIEIKQQTSVIVSDTVDKENEQLASESSDILMQTKTRTVPSSPAVSEDTQTGDENRNSLKNETAYHTASDDKDTASVVENTYDGDKTTAPSSVKTPSIEHQKEEDLVIAGSKSANSEPSRAAENDESATPIPEQQHLAAQFDTVKADESVTTGPIDNSGTKASTDIQPSELNIDAVLDYNDFVESIDSVEQPKHVIPTAANVPPSQEQEDAGNVSVEYETNETSTEEVVNTAASISVKEQPDQSAIVSLSTQDIVEHGESSLSVREESPADHGPTRPDIVNEPTTHGVIEVTHETDETIGLEAMNVTLPAAAVTVSEGKNQIDLPPKLNEELVVDKRVYETQTSLVEQLYHDDATVECSHGKDNEFWAEEDTVFFVEQQSPAVEPEVSSAEVVTIALPMEATTAREEVDDLKLSVDDEIGVDMDFVGQLDNSKAASVPEITNDYEPEEQIAITASLATELIPDVELDEPAVEILEERIMPREECDNIVMEASEKSDLPRTDDEVETIIADTSDVEPTIDLLEAQEELAATEVSEAVESELDEQNDLAVTSAVDSYGYNSGTSAVSDNVLVVKSRLSSGLWPDDSRLNPEEESASTTQSSADDTSLVSRLVGMFVVAMCVVRGRQARAIPNS